VAGDPFPKHRPTNEETKSAMRGAEQGPPEAKAASGTMWRIRFDEHRLYVTVNHDGRRVLEVFARGAVSSAGVGLLASQMLRGGFGVKDVAEFGESDGDSFIGV
jgi:hypothetical protein